MNNPTIDNYMASIGRRSVPLTSEEEKTASPAKLVEANLLFAFSQAQKFAERHYSIPIEDLVQQASLGLHEASVRFKPEKGYRFISYAVWWIKQKMTEYAAKDDVVRQPGNQKAKGIAHAGYVRMDLEGVRDGEFIPSLHNRLPDSSATTPEEKFMHLSDCEMIERVFAKMSPRDVDVVKLYYGFDGAEPMTLEEIGKIHGITRERVRQIRNRAMGEIKKYFERSEG